MPVPAEGFPLTATDVYPGIAPERFQGTHKDKVVFLTGGGTGLGLAAAKAFSQTGAKVFLAARRTDPLQAAKTEIEVLGGEVDFAVVDVTDPKSVQAGVDAAIKRFGKIDIVIANAGRDKEPGEKIADSDIDDWWTCVESSLKGSFLTAHSTLPHLATTKGYIIFLSSVLAQSRIPGGSAYNIAKHSLNRLAEWVDIEYRDQGVKSFAVHPGGVSTDLTRKLKEAIPGGDKIFSQSPNLSAWSYVRLTSGSEDWLSGRYVDTTWGLDEVTRLKEKIVEQDALKNRLALPV